MRSQVYLVCLVVFSVATGKPAVPFSPEEDVPILGGFRTIEEDGTGDLKEIASYAANALFSSINSRTVELVRIISAERQIVAGYNYAMKLELKCLDENHSFICDVVVWEQPWLNSRTIAGSSCSPHHHGVSAEN